MKHFSMNFMSRSAISLFTLAVFALAPLSASAAEHQMYFGGEMGFAIQEDVDIKSSDNDAPTRCDRILEAIPNRATGGASFLPLTDARCARGDNWETDDVGIDVGVFAGFQLGVRLDNNLRAELEYIFNSHSGGDIEDNEGAIVGKETEFQVAEQGITGVSSHSFLVNMFYDFEKNGKYTPYIGAGIGFAEVDVEFQSTFARHLNPARLGSTAPDAAAGTTSFINDTVNDSVFVWQLMGGVDYEIDNAWSVGLKARYMVYEDVEDGGSWDRLRSHDSEIAPGVPVEYETSIEDMTAWALGANLKYNF